MKYEYLKGSEKDFEGAPEWARLVVEHCKFEYNTWFYESDKAGGKWKQCKGQLRGVVERDGIGHWLNIIAERRPITEPVWSGEGLPPVGVECEVNDERTGSWKPVDSVLAHACISGRPVAVFQIGEYIAYSPTDRFRPIRSPEDVERDEAIDAIFSILSVNILDGSDSNAGKIYDAIAAGKIPGITLSDK